MKEGIGRASQDGQVFFVLVATRGRGEHSSGRPAGLSKGSDGRGGKRAGDKKRGEISTGRRVWEVKGIALHVEPRDPLPAAWFYQRLDFIDVASLREIDPVVRISCFFCRAPKNPFDQAGAESGGKAERRRRPKTVEVGCGRHGHGGWRSLGRYSRTEFWD